MSAGLDRLEVVDVEGAEGQSCGALRLEVGGRVLRVLVCTPGWWERRFRELGLEFYWGPSFIVLERLDRALAERAVRERLSSGGPGWFAANAVAEEATLDGLLRGFRRRHFPGLDESLRKTR